MIYISHVIVFTWVKKGFYKSTYIMTKIKYRYKQNKTRNSEIHFFANLLEAIFHIIL